MSESSLPILGHSPFPCPVRIGDVEVMLNVDGTWTGDLKAIRQAAAELKAAPSEMSVILWLVLRQLTQDVC